MEMNHEEEKVKGIIPVLACVLQQLCVANDDLSFDPKKAVSKFHALCIPTLGIKGYLERIAKYSGCSPECFVLCLVYIDRIIQSRGFIVNSYSIHRLLITGTMLAAKFFDDHYYNNAYYAKVGGVNADEMNSLEVEFLFMLNFHLFVSTRTYKLYYQELFAHTNNSKAVCGCTGAKVPPLVFPFPSTPDEKSKLSENVDSTDTAGPDLSIDDDDGYDDDPETYNSPEPQEGAGTDSKQDSKQGPPPGVKQHEERKEEGKGYPLTASSDISMSTAPDTRMTDVTHSRSQSSHSSSGGGGGSSSSSSTISSSSIPPERKTLPQQQLPVGKTGPSTAGARELLGWQSPLARRPHPEEPVEASARGGTARTRKPVDTEMTIDSPPRQREQKSMDLSSSSRPPSSTGPSEEMIMSDSPVSKSRPTQPPLQPPLSTTLPQQHSIPPSVTPSTDRVVIGRKASDYSGAPIPRSLTLKQTQFWRFQQQLSSQPQSGHILLPNGGVPIQKSASATLPTQQPAYPPSTQQQQQQQRLRRGMSSVQSVTVR